MQLIPGPPDGLKISPKLSDRRRCRPAKASRLALAFLAADGVVVPTSWRIDLLAVASIASAVVLTGGTAYLAHAIAVARSRRGVLVALWTAALACSGALIAPAIVATLRAQPLSVVLSAQRHWGWSICAVLAVDLVASGAMLRA